MAKAKITVLVCTYKRKQLLDGCLRSLIDVSSELPDEIVVVDGEEGGARDIISKWQGRHSGIKFIATNNINLAASRNIGLSHCTGDIIAMTDDDVEVSSNWIETMRKLYQAHPYAGAIGGKIQGFNRDR